MNDTIAAIATASGGGVGIVRISGVRAEEIVRALCPSLGSWASHQMVLSKARDGDEVLDEVLAVVMRAPRSYTGEDVAELHAHGGAANLSRLLHAVLARGARLAEPGEFTRRALLAGKLDLAEAEGVAAVIGARDLRSLRAAHALRSGALGQVVGRVRSTIVSTLAEIEGALDFPDEVQGEPSLDGLVDVARELRAWGEARRAVTSVPEVVLVGAVNAGKSSLLNALCGETRALVDAEPGTTRDVVEAELQLGSLLVRVLDTAGLREAPTELERRGQALADGRRRSAALTLHVFDAQRGWSSEDEALVHTGAVIVVENKSDLADAGHAGAQRVSTRTGEGINALRQRIEHELGDSALASPRQAEAFTRAAAAVELALEHARAPEVAAVELRRALFALGQLTGETVDAAVLDELFSRFCIGK